MQQPVVKAQHPLVAQRDTLPVAGLADDRKVWRLPGAGQVPCPPAVGLFFHGADHHHAKPIQVGLDPGGGQHKGRQRAFGIHRPPPMQPACLLPHRDQARHGVHVSQQHDFVASRGIAEGAHHVARLVTAYVKAKGRHLPDQVVGNSIFLPGWAGDGEQRLQES